MAETTIRKCGKSIFDTDLRSCIARLVYAHDKARETNTQHSVEHLRRAQRRMYRKCGVTINIDHAQPLPIEIYVGFFTARLRAMGVAVVQRDTT